MLCGCLQSSQSNNNLYGKWTKDYCDCDKNSKDKFFYNDDIVKEIYWRSTNLVNDHVRRLTNVGRVLILGLGEIMFKGTSLTHDYVEVLMQCHICKKEKWVTFEYGFKGKQCCVGYYSRNHSLHACISNCENRTMGSIKEKFDDLKGFGKGTYHFIKHNCKTFAKTFFQLL